MKDILDRVVREARDSLRENLISIVLYGSHARGEATPKSDVNLLFVVTDHSPEALAPLTKLAPSWMKKRVAPPVIFPQQQIARSLDTFALEFLEMAAARNVLYGEDPFANFAPDWATVRAELEREARQKRIALTRRWLAAGGKSAALRSLCADTVSGYLTLLRGAVMLERKQAAALTVDAVFAELAKQAWFRKEVWLRLRSVAAGQTKLSTADLQILTRHFLEQAIALVQWLDGME